MALDWACDGHINGTGLGPVMGHISGTGLGPVMGILVALDWGL